MNKTVQTILVFLSLIVFVSVPFNSRASHAAGAELSYVWISDSTYQLSFKFYRDCTGIQEDSVINVCCRNTCNSFIDDEIILRPITTLPGGLPNGSPVSVGCSSYPTRCEDKQSTLPGYREWWYTTTYTLPSRCDNWVFSASINARNASNNIMGGNLYVEAIINNKDAPGNSSPSFSIKPVPYVCMSQDYSYNNGAYDKDNDSLGYEIITPQNAFFCNPPLPIAFRPATPGLNLSTNPFQTNNTFKLDPFTGQISFKPGLLGPQTISLRVKEYRNGKLIGSVMRDIQIQVLDCNGVPTTSTIDPMSLYKDTVINDIVQGCADVTMSFCFNVKSVDSESILRVTDNHASVIPAAGVYYSAQPSDSIRGCFNWTPSKADVGLKVFSVTVKDSTCKPPGISISQTFSFPINIRLAVNYLRDTAICLGDTINVRPFYGSVFHWSSWYGNPNLECTDCYSPRVAPQVNSGYLVQTDENAFCGKNIDTVTVKMKTEIPGKPSATSNTPVCDGDTIRLYGSPLTNGGYRWSGPDGFSDTIQNPVIPNVTFKNEGRYFIQTYSYISNCPSRISSTDVDILPIPFAFFQYPEDICVGQDALIRPDRDYNSIYYWNFAGADNVDTSKLNIHYASWNTGGEKNVILRLRGQNGCYSLPDTGTINVHDKPEAKINSLSKNNICTNDTVTLTALYKDIYTYSWVPDKIFLTAKQYETTGIIPFTGNVFLQVTDIWGCINTDSIFVNTYPCCDAFLPDAFTPNGDGKNDAFRILTTGHHMLSKFMIINRWGQSVFDTKDEHEGWDGTFHGVKLDAGSYFYYLKYKCSDDRIMEKKGTVTLIR